MCSTSLMVAPFFIAFHGSKAQLIDAVSQQYVRYVTQRYGHVSVVFEGYTANPTTKDVTHLRRGSSSGGVVVHFTGNMTVQYKKDVFLNNEENKQRFIHFLSDKLERAGCDTNHAVNAADVLIIKAAVVSAHTKTTAVIGDDTDLLVLLLYLTDASTHDLSGSRTKAIFNMSIQKSKQLLDPRVSQHILFLHAVQSAPKGCKIPRVRAVPVRHLCSKGSS